MLYLHRNNYNGISNYWQCSLTELTLVFGCTTWMRINTDKNGTAYVAWRMPYNFVSFHTAVTAEALRAKIGRKSAILHQRGHFDPKFLVQGVALVSLFLLLLLQRAPKSYFLTDRHDLYAKTRISGQGFAF